MRGQKVYLCGAINGCTDNEAMGWRRNATLLLADNGFQAVDPMARDYRGKEDQNWQAIVEGDLEDIRSVGSLLVNAERASWGTAMEIHAAWTMGLQVVAFVPSGKPVSPWLRYHTRDNIAPNLDAAVVQLVRLLS